jgi:DNA invertase Pin-like site-specific DNA recombinase
MAVSRPAPFAEFERAMIREHVKAGLERARAQGKPGTQLLLTPLGEGGGKRRSVALR